MGHRVSQDVSSRQIWHVVRSRSDSSSCTCLYIHFIYREHLYLIIAGCHFFVLLFIAHITLCSLTLIVFSIRVNVLGTCTK